VRIEREEIKEKIRGIEKGMKNLKRGDKRGEWIKGSEGKRYLFDKGEIEQKLKEIERKLEEEKGKREKRT